MVSLLYFRVTCYPDQDLDQDPDQDQDQDLDLEPDLDQDLDPDPNLAQDTSSFLCLVIIDLTSCTIHAGIQFFLCRHCPPLVRNFLLKLDLLFVFPPQKDRNTQYQKSSETNKNSVHN